MNLLINISVIIIMNAFINFSTACNSNFTRKLTSNGTIHIKKSGNKIINCQWTYLLDNEQEAIFNIKRLYLNAGEPNKSNSENGFIIFRSNDNIYFNVSQLYGNHTVAVVNESSFIIEARNFQTIQLEIDYYYISPISKSVVRGSEKGWNSSDRKLNTWAMVMIALIPIMIIIFTFLIIRWKSNRRDLNRLMSDFPEAALPEFLPPDDINYVNAQNLINARLNQFTDADFCNGGEIFESFMQAMAKEREENPKNWKTFRHVRIWDSDKNETTTVKKMEVPQTTECIGKEIMDTDSESQEDADDNEESSDKGFLSLRDFEIAELLSRTQTDSLKFYKDLTNDKQKSQCTIHIQ